MTTFRLGPNFSFIKLPIDHSWFVTFDRDFGGILPLWFSRWWMHFGLIPYILPLKLIESFTLFKDRYKVDTYGSKFPPILHFAKKYRIPWILKWQYVIVGDKLERHWYIKWWDKYFVDNIVKYVKEFVLAPKAQNLNLPSTTTQNLPSSTTHNLPSNAPSILLTPDVFIPPIKDASPAPKTSPPASSTSSKKKSSLSKKKKKALMKAFLESLDAGSDEDEEESNASSEATCNLQREFFGNSGFDSQEYFPRLEDL